jgi:hypothetical protein
MAEQTGTRVRVILKWLQILESLDTDDTGEFVFNFRVFTRNNGGMIQETRLPEEGHLEISESRMSNRLDHINKVLFDGYVSDHLKIEAQGEEIDQFSANELLDQYQREFTGDVATFLGRHNPGDEGSIDPENMGNWRICYDIEAVS